MSAHYPRKRFGQNFLHDQSVIASIVANLQAKPGEHWVEIGPGQGALTAPLLAKGVVLDVVELDRDLVELLRRKFSEALNKLIPHMVRQAQDERKQHITVRPEPVEGLNQGFLSQNPQLTIHSADALKFDFARLAKPGEKLRIVGNLPYNISTPLLFHLLKTTDCIADMHFMLQKEVVSRICANPGSKQYGRLSVMMQYYCQAECLFDVAPESFEPIPQVTSAIIRLQPHTTPPVIVKDKALFDKVVAQAFSQRRKTIRNSLKTLVSEDVLVSLGIEPTARAETISLQDFARLSNRIQEDENRQND